MWRLLGRAIAACPGWRAGLARARACTPRRHRCAASLILAAHTRRVARRHREDPAARVDPTHASFGLARSPWFCFRYSDRLTLRRRTGCVQVAHCRMAGSRVRIP